MNSTLSLLLRLALAQGLTNKEAFVETVGSFLQNKMGQDAENAEKYGEHIVSLLENLNSQLIIDKLMESNSSNAKLEKQIEALTKAINELNKKIEGNSNSKT